MYRPRNAVWVLTLLLGVLLAACASTASITPPTAIAIAPATIGVPVPVSPTAPAIAVASTAPTTTAATAVATENVAAIIPPLATTTAAATTLASTTTTGTAETTVAPTPPLTTASAVVGDDEVLLQSRFDAPDNTWPLGETEYFKAGIGGGVYLAEIKTAQRLLTIPTDASNGLANGAISADVTLRGDTRSLAGLMLHYTEQDNVARLYTCAINNGGKFVCSRIDNANGTPLASGPSTAIKPNATNTLSMRFRDNEIVFAINEQDVARFRDDTFPSGRAGFYVENFDEPITVTFDNVIVSKYR